MELQVRLFPPLNNTAGRSLVKLDVPEGGTIQQVIDELIAQFGPDMRRHLYDDQGRIIPAWSVFVGGRPVQLNRPESLSTVIPAGGEVALILNIAGG